jgi:protein O-GlcNAc transferase
MHLLETGAYAEAAEQAGKAAERDPASAHAWFLAGTALHRLGRREEAIAALGRATGLDPGSALAHHNLGVVFLELRRFAECEGESRAALGCTPDLVEAGVNLAAAVFAQGRAGEAEAVLRAMLVARPASALVAFNLATLLTNSGRADEARPLLAKALQGAPGQPEILALLCDVLSRLGRHDEALRSLEELLSLQPGNAAAHNNRGTALLRLDRLADAEAAFRRAVSLDPALALAWHNLGCALLERGRAAECVEAERRALAIDPQNMEAAISLSAALNKLNRGSEAEPLLRKALARDPGNVRVAINLCAALGLQKRHDEALALAVEAAQRRDAGPDAHGMAACLLSQEGMYGESLVQFDEAIRLEPGSVHWQVLRALAMPIIPDSLAQIRSCREDMLRRVAQLQGSALGLEDPMRWLGQTGFFLAYQGLENLELQRSIADMYLRLHPALGWRAPAAAPRSRKGRRLRVGFLSAFLHGHTIGKLNQGFVAALDRDRFEVFVFHADARQDATRSAIDASADHVAVLPPLLGEARQVVSDAGLDVLLFPDVGMHHFCYFLACARLAPVQVTSWGHPDTTGLPNIDYFVSSDLIEPADAQPHYSERLVRLTRLPTCYSRPRAAPPVGIRRQLGIAPGTPIYACPQSLFKFHPEFDATLGRLLEADPEGLLLLVKSGHAAWDAALTERFRRAFPHCVERVRFAPFLPESAFLELLDAADAVLDPAHFGGGNSTYEALGLGVPIVTMPGPLMRGRVTLGCYRQMGFEDLVAATPEEYVAMAVRLAHDPSFREAMRQRIRERSGALFDDRLAVRELEAFMERAFDEALEGAGTA